MKKIIETELLLGFTRENNVIFSNITVREDNDGIKTFSASFSEVSPVLVTDELIDERKELLLDNMTVSEKFDLLEMYDEKPSNIKSCIDDNIHELIDTSLYSNEIYLGDEILVFESDACGQHDVRNKITNCLMVKSDFEFIITLWDNIHLKEINSLQFLALEKIISKYKNVDIDNTVKNYMQELFDNGLL